MRDLQKTNMSVSHYTFRFAEMGVYGANEKWFSVKRKLFPNGNGALDAME